MDKQRLIAARKKLKEFQRNKKEQVTENVTKHPDPQKYINDQIKFEENSPETHKEIIQQQNLEKQENNQNIDSEIRNSNECSNLFNNENHVNNYTAIQENASVQNVCFDHESINGTVEIPSYNNFTPDHTRNESTSLMSSQNIHENFDQNASQPETFSSIQFDHSNIELNTSNNTSGSLQKEHLLQMANAVANILVDEQGIDESVLNNCDLEQRNQFLSWHLEEQKKLVNQLHIQLSQCNSKVSELEAIISTKDTEFQARLMREVNPLEEQIQLNAQTIGILVGEKAELTATNSQCQTIIKQKTEEVIELSGKLKSSQQQVLELERELTSLKNNMEDYVKSYQQLQNNYENLVDKSSKLKKENEDFELLTAELRQKLNLKNTELTSLEQELQEKVALLCLSELRMKQLSNSPEEVNSLETQHHATKMLEQQLSQMKEAFESISGEKDEVSKKYQSYVQQLDERHSKLLTELEASKKVIVESDIREQSYIQRLSELEQQLQREKAKFVKPVEDHSEKIEMLTKSMDNLVLEQENLQSLLNEKDNEIEVLKKELRELHDIREQSIEASKLATALQGEQLGASRAVLQNQQLKTQLDEMHDAFIALSNTKLDLTEQLQAERVIGKKLNSQLNDVEQQVDELKKELIKKEVALVELEKEKLHSAQIEDQIQHYQAQSHSATTLQQELQNALMTIESLKKENQLLQSKFEKVKDVSTINDEASQEISEIVPGDIGTVNNLNIKVRESADSLDKEVSNEQSVTLPENSTIPSIPEPIKKLENRFKETMERVAELTDEKQRLEHLVLQLQGETETIGEYVTLYQKQRAILQDKAKERDTTFKQLLEQRNQQQEQLHKLKVLVAQLLKSKNCNSNITTATIADETTPITDHLPESDSNNIEVIDGHVNKEDVTMYQTDKTTSQILDLLTEIKDCNNACIMEPNFHPCPWCSGKLITV